MVAIAPFRALRYDTDKVRLSQVTSPPHDVIEPDEQVAFRARDEHNIVHVIQPVEDEAAGLDKYAHADAILKRWQDEGALIRDDKPALYLYEVTHPGADGEPVTMRGFYCRIAIDPTYTHIKRHEKTLPKKKKDRLHLKAATSCDTESIWMLYRDERGWVDEILTSNAFEELARFTDGDGVEHALLRVDRDEAVGEVVAQFEDRDVVIADGHHRYQTALDHHAATGRDEDASILVCMVRDTDVGLRIEPTHRLVSGIGYDDLATALERASAHWTTEPLPVDDDATAAGAALRAWVDADPNRCIILHKDGAVGLTLKEGHSVDEGRGRLDGLVVTRVHDRLLAPMGVDMDRVEEFLHYTRSATEAVEAIRQGRAPFCVMLTGEDVDAVLDVASQGHVMPQKSTYFVPKLRSGVVMGPLDEPRPRDWQEIASA